MRRHPRSWWALLGLGLSLAAGCSNDDSAPPTPAERFCSSVAAQAASCGTGTPCDEALVTDCAGVAGLFNDSLLAASATCVDEGGNPLSCVVDSRESVMKSAAHDAFAAAFCSECALGISGCEETLFGTHGDDDLAVIGALITPLGDALVTELQNECASGLTCLATFTSCAQEVLARQALPTETLTCVVEQLTTGGGGGGGGMNCAATEGMDSASASASESESESASESESESASESGTSAGVETSDSAEDTSTGSSLPSDPNYPNPFADACPGGTDPLGFEGSDESFCSPLCVGGSCPSGETGDAAAACVLSPLSSFDPCGTDVDCSGTETCMDTVCILPPTHCALLCDGGQTCPDGMACSLGICLYSP